MMIPPVAAAQAGQASGGGLIDTFKNVIAGATGGTPGAAGGPTQAPANADGSVGLFDGVLKKALIGGAAGGVLGFVLPFGGPILGGIVGALGGAALGVFGNFRKMSAIKAENEATLAAMGVQVNDPQAQQILQSGNVQQLIPLVQQKQQEAAAGVGQAGVGQAGVGQAGVGQAGTNPAETVGPDGKKPPRIQQVTDPATGKTELIDVANGVRVDPAQLQAAGAPAQVPAVVDPSSAPQQSPLPTQGAINPSGAVNPGVAPALQGGGSAGDAGRPPAPAGVSGSSVTAIAPAQAGVGATTTAMGTTEAVAGVASLDRAQIAALVQRLDAQVEQLKQYLAEQERLDQLDKAAAR